MSRLVLGIDTTGRGGAVALADDGAVLGLEVHDPALGYAEELFGLFDRLLERCRRNRHELDAIAVLTGPGSFTGLRIGVMTAKTLAFALRRPLLGAPTLELVAAAAGPGVHRAVSDAGGGHVWAQIVEVDTARVQARGPVQRLRPETLTDGPELVSAGPSAFGRSVGDLAGPLARLAAAGQAPVREVDPAALVPEYVSISQAERTHGVDLSAELRRPIEPQGWDR